MILEAIVSTRNDDGSTNLAPMGPYCAEADFGAFELRPYRTSTTWHNLSARGEGVLHVTDDALLFVQAVLNCVPMDRPLRTAKRVDCRFDAGACRIYEFEVSHIDASQPRASIQCQTIHAARLREFFGFNRARHLLIEAAILATRMDFIPLKEIVRRLEEFAPTIGKTGGPREMEALELLRAAVRENSPRGAQSAPTGPLP
jgi:hypothetical protein